MIIPYIMEHKKMLATPTRSPWYPHKMDGSIHLNTRPLAATPNNNGSDSKVEKNPAIVTSIIFYNLIVDTLGEKKTRTLWLFNIAMENGWKWPIYSWFVMIYLLYKSGGFP